MEYNDLNSYLGNLELTNTTSESNNISSQRQNTNTNYVNNEFSNLNKFTDSSIENKPKSRKQIENLSINRNMVLSSLNKDFNFESVNPQRIQSIDTRNNYRDDVRNTSSEFNNSVRQNSNVDYELNRNLQVHTSQRNLTNIMDYSQFSEDYKSYKNNDYKDSFDKDSLNDKISSRDNIPNISSVPSSLWDN